MKRQFSFNPKKARSFKSVLNKSWIRPEKKLKTSQNPEKIVLDLEVLKLYSPVEKVVVFSRNFPRKFRFLEISTKIDEMQRED